MAVTSLAGHDIPKNSEEAQADDQKFLDEAAPVTSLAGHVDSDGSVGISFAEPAPTPRRPGMPKRFCLHAHPGGYAYRIHAHVCKVGMRACRP